MWRDMHISFYKLVDALCNWQFDRKYGVETRKEVRPYDFLVRTTNVEHATRYQASHVRLLNRVFERLNIPYNEYTFVDIGAGKGRALMVASLYGFRRVVGVEFAENLVETCRRNLTKFGAECELFEGDVLEMAPIGEKCVYLLFNPFSQLMVKKVIEHHLLRGDSVRDNIIVSINPRTEFQFNLAGFEKFDEIADPNFNKFIHFYRYTGV